jgi:hypothetical protein
MKRSNSNSVRYGVPLASTEAKRSRTGRRCAEPTCVTVLSVYNAAETCWLHSTATPRHALAPTETGR